MNAKTVAFGVGIGLAIGVGVFGMTRLYRARSREYPRSRSRKQLGAVDEKLIQRVANALSYDVPKKEIREQLVDEGYSDEDVYLAYKAAQLHLKYQDEGLGSRHARHANPLEAKREIFELLRENRQAETEVARDIALDYGLIQTGKITKFAEPVNQRDGDERWRIEVDHKPYYTEALSLMMAPTGTVIDFHVGNKQDMWRPHKGEWLERLHHAVVFRVADRPQVSDTTIKRYINRWWPEDGSEALEGAKPRRRRGSLKGVERDISAKIDDEYEVALDAYRDDRISDAEKIWRETAQEHPDYIWAATKAYVDALNIQAEQMFGPAQTEWLGREKRYTLSKSGPNAYYIRAVDETLKVRPTTPSVGLVDLATGNIWHIKTPLYISKEKIWPIIENEKPIANVMKPPDVLDILPSSPSQAKQRGTK